MIRPTILNALSSEVVVTVGCTDPVCVSYAASEASNLLGKEPDKIEITVSNNIYKNGMRVGIPGTDKQGLHYAAALGIYLQQHSREKLEILGFVDSDVIDKANQLTGEQKVTVKIDTAAPDTLYVKAHVFSGVNDAYVVVSGDYDRIIETGSNGIIKSTASEGTENGSVISELIKYPLFDIIDEITFKPCNDLEFLIDMANINRQSYDLSKKLFTDGFVYPQKNIHMELPFNAMQTAKDYTFTLAKARMNGLKVPVVAVAGSGNHGITNFLGVLALAETMKVSKESLIKALAISTATVIYIKGYIKRMTAFCGCSVAASTGVAAASTYLFGGDKHQMVGAMNSLIGALAGILCDGAKETCAYKLSVGASSAIEYAYLSSKCNISPPPVCGIISSSIEKTFETLATINNPGMKETDLCMVKVIEKNYERGE